MKAQLIKLWDEIRSSYWFVPLLMSITAVLLSYLMIWLDGQTQWQIKERFGFIWGGGADGARELLSTVAGSMITVAGITFSIIIVALSQASSQFGPHLLRNFMRDTGNQIVLGTFIATFVYCLMILRAVRGDEDNVFVPHVAVTFTLFLAMLSLGVLIYFIHHAALSIQAPSVIAQVAGDLFHTIEKLFPSDLGENKPDQRKPDLSPEQMEEWEGDACPIPSQDSGYLQIIDGDRLLQLAIEHDLTLLIKFRPGHFVLRDKPLVMAAPAAKINEKLTKQIRQMFVLDYQRTHIQDVEFAVNQLVEVAVRSLSTGVNDPFTAMTCIDWLGAALAQLADKPLPSRYRYDDEGHLRVVVENPDTFAGATAAAFDQIRQNAGKNVAVRIRLLETIALVTGYVQHEEDWQALLHQADMIRRDSYDLLQERSDLEDIEDRYQQIVKTRLTMAIDDQ
jgi:uncharacterized membrane protein